MKSINTYNYEEFFLLYADGELTATERQAVEEFVLLNKEYEEEFSLIKDSVLTIEEIEMPSTDSLTADNVQANWEERLLLLLDEELEAEEAKTVQKEIEGNEAREVEWASLKKTKLSAEEKFIFKNKKVLYKKAPGKLVAWDKVRWLAAAMLIGFGLFAGYNYLKQQQNTGNGNNSVAVKTEKSIEQPAINVIKEEGEKNISNTSQEENTLAQAKRQRTEAASDVRNTKDATAPFIKEHKTSANQNKTLAANATNISLQKKISTVKTIPIIKNEEKKLSTYDIAKLDIPVEQKTMITDVNLKEERNPYAGSASFAQNDEKSNNKILYMDEERLAKSKPGIFLRKVKRFIERKTDIETGNSIKVAGFEIALK